MPGVFKYIEILTPLWKTSKINRYREDLTSNTETNIPGKKRIEPEENVIMLCDGYSRGSMRINTEW